MSHENLVEVQEHEIRLRTRTRTGTYESTELNVIRFIVFVSRTEMRLENGKLFLAICRAAIEY